MAKITIKQHDITDCGAACLASIATHYNLRLPLAKIRQLTGTDKRGTNVLGLLEAAYKIGFEGKGVRGDFNSLFEIPKPAIAHMFVKKISYHYVVIYKVTSTYISIMDPSCGKMYKKTHKEFKKEWTGVLVLLLPKENFSTGNEKFSVYKRFWTLLKPHKYILIQALIGAIVYTLLGFSMAIYVQKITDFVLVGGNTKLLNLLGIIMLILLLIQITIGSFKDVFLVKSGQQIDLRLILGYYRHIMKLPQQFFDTMRVGEIVSRINDAVKIRTFINEVSLDLTVNMLIIIFSFALMFSYYWKLALIIVLVIPFYLSVYVLMNHLNRKTERRLMENSADLESQLVESLNTMGTIKRFAIEDFVAIKMETRFIDLLKTGYKSALNSIFSGTSSWFISRLFTILLLWCGSYFVIDREISPGELMSFYSIIAYFTGPVAGLIEANREIQNALIAADRLFETMDLEREESENKIILKKKDIGDIHFRNVFFRYGTRVEVFQDLNLIIPKGKITAFIGESGSGKSTLASLLQKIYPIQRGSIVIGDLDLKYVDNSSLRNLIGVVPQKIDLFAGNVIQNISVGEFTPNIERINEICKEVGILEFIKSLPNGFNTYLGENGAILSGGQKQRIAIARALYKNPEVLLLDEATSSLDSTSENFIRSTTKKLIRQGKTVIIIAHRLSTIIDADKVVVLHKGEVLEEGPPSVLLKKKGHYFDFYRKPMF